MRFTFLSFLMAIALWLPPGSHAAASVKQSSGYNANGGILVVSTGKDFSYSFGVAKGDPRQSGAMGKQLWIGTSERMYQHVVVEISSIITKRPATDREVLELHTQWEANHFNKVTNEKLRVRPSFHNIKGRTWCHWSYDVSVVFKKNPPPKSTKGPAAATRQHFLTTVLNDQVLVIACSTMKGQTDFGTKRLLTKAAKSFVLYPKALSKNEIEALCKQPLK